MEYSYESEMRGRHVMKKTSTTSSITRKSFQSESEGQRRLVEMEAKGQPFGRHDMKKFSKETYSTMSSESFSYRSTNKNFGSVYERSNTTKFIGGGDNRRFLEAFTKSSDRSDEQPVVLVMKNKSQIDVPEWMEEQKSPGTERRDVDISDINAFLEYPSDYSPSKKELEDKVKESKIRPEVAKRDKQDIPVLPAEDDDEEESDEEYDEFEEEIVVMNVRRNPLWRKGLQIPKPEPEKVGIPIEDLLEIPTLEAKQESAPDELLIDEKIESVERPPMVHAEVPYTGILEKL